MVEGPVDLAMVTGLEDALPRFGCGIQMNLSIWPVVPLSLGCRARILLGCSLWHWFELSIGLPYFLTFENKFGIKHLTWCFVWCMHAWYKKYRMICHAQKCPINHALLPKYAQYFEGKERKKHNSNLNRFFIFFWIFSIALSWTFRRSLIFLNLWK